MTDDTKAETQNPDVKHHEICVQLPVPGSWYTTGIHSHLITKSSQVVNPMTRKKATAVADADADAAAADTTLTPY